MSETNENPEPAGDTIAVVFDTLTQHVSLQFDRRAFRNWDFVISVLEQARRCADDMKRVAIMTGMRQQQQEAALGQAMLRRLKH